MINSFKNFLPFFLPFAIPFSRSVADITVILISLLFLIKSYEENDWKWLKESWVKLSFTFVAYCIFINSSLSINKTESFYYSLFFLRWPIFAAALSFWIFNDTQKLKIFLKVLSLILIFLLFDIWFQYFFGKDIFGIEIMTYNQRLTGPLSGPYVGMWVTKIFSITFLIFFLFKKNFFLKNSRFLIFFPTCFLILFFSVFITGERMALLMTIMTILLIFIGLIGNKTFSFFSLFFFFLFIFFILYIISYALPYEMNRGVYSTIEKISNWKNSDYGLVWMSAYDVWMLNPFFGAGLHQYRDACESLQIYGTFHDPIGAGVCFHPHNITMQLLSETGLVGFIIFYMIVFMITIELLNIYLKKGKWLLSFVMINIILTCFLPIQSNTDFFSNKYSSIIWLIVGVSIAFKKLSKIPD